MRKINEQQKITLILSDYAHETLRSDNMLFHPEDTFPKFINHILAMYCEQSSATISALVSKYRDNLNAILMDRPARSIQTISAANRTAIIDRLVQAYESSLVENKPDYDPHVQVNLRLNNQNCEYIFGEDYQYREDEDFYWADEKYYQRTLQSSGVQTTNGALPRYLSAVLEDYSRKSAFQRESIVFADIIQTLESAYKNHSLVRVALSFPAEAVKTRIFDVRIYGLSKETESDMHYLIGRSAPVVEGASDKANENIASFRLSRIEKVMIRQHRSGTLTAAEKKEIAKRIERVGISFLLNDQEDIVIRFSERGIKQYNMIRHLRPACTGSDSNGDQHFQCSLRQAEVYFFAFGADAEVISPATLRNRLAEQYRTAAEKYTQA